VLFVFHSFSLPNWWVESPPSFRYNAAMNSSQPDQAVDYLVIGHITRDLTPHGPRVGGTAAYAALLANRSGLRTGVVTSTAGDLDLSPLRGISILNIPSQETTTFQNSYSPQGRKQIILAKADPISFHDIPLTWRKAKIVHLAPVIQEIPPPSGSDFPDAGLGFSLQGWLRGTRPSGRVDYLSPAVDFPEYSRREAAGVVSLEDLDGRESRLEPLLDLFSTLILTRGTRPLSIYRAGNSHSVSVQPRPEIDPTGAGDIFAAAFFISYFLRGNARKSARAAADLAATSVDKPGLAGVPAESELKKILKVNQAWEKSIP